VVARCAYNRGAELHIGFRQSEPAKNLAGGSACPTSGWMPDRRSARTPGLWSTARHAKKRSAIPRDSGWP